MFLRAEESLLIAPLPGSLLCSVSNTRVAAFECGSGLYAARLAKLGANVTGIDFSKNSIEHARKVAAGEGLRIQYTLRNYLEFEDTEQ